jgi:hypothetical protein
MPEALSNAPSKYESWCAMMTMSSSVAPGRLPQTLASFNPGRISVVSLTCIVTAPLASIFSSAAASWLPIMNVGMPGADAASLVTLPGMEMLTTTAAGASVGGALQRAGERGGVLKAARLRFAVDERQLALDVAAGEVELGAHPDPHDAQIHSGGGSRG